MAAQGRQCPSADHKEGAAVRSLWGWPSTAGDSGDTKIRRKACRRERNATHLLSPGKLGVRGSWEQPNPDLLGV